MGFLETGFGVFAVIMLWNVFLLGFGGISDSPYITDQSFSGLESTGSINLNQLGSTSITSEPYISPTTTPEENVPFYVGAFNETQNTTGLILKLFVGGADAIEKSGIPSPINWVMAWMIKAFMTGYVALFLFSLVSGIRGGGVGGA